MSRAYVSNFSKLLDDEGKLAASLPITTKRLFVHLTKIIEYVSARGLSSGAAQPGLPPLICWSAPYKKRCDGPLDASIEFKNYDIHWHCLRCGNHGVISRWRGSVWDKGLR